jgi:hypothetical protein
MNQGSYEFPVDYRSIMCSGKIEMIVKQIQDLCSVKKKVGYLWSLAGSDAQGTQSEF